MQKGKSHSIEIAGRKVGPGHRPLVVAEISGNHNGELERALALITAAKQAGADAVKFQTYTADTMTIPSDRSDFKISGGLWDGQTLYELYQWAHTPWAWHEALFARAREEGLIAFSSPFDERAVELLESLNVPAYKIASFEMVDLPLIKQVASCGKPVVISTGMASVEEVSDAVATVRTTGNNQLILLHCISAYPADHRDYNIRTLKDLAERFNVIAGLSDHTLDNTMAVSSVALGSCFIEKHFTLDRSEGGPDAAFSLQPEELRSLCSAVDRAWESLGEVQYGVSEAERGSTIFRRSLYVVEDIAEGEPFTEKNLRRIRPGYGLSPKYYEQILGKQAKMSLKRGTPLNNEMVHGWSSENE